MFTPQVTMLAVIILGLLVWAASLSIRLRNAQDKTKAAETKRDYYASNLERQLSEYRRSIDSMQSQLRRKDTELRDAMRMMNHKAALKCITFMTRTSGLVRVAVGHTTKSISYDRKGDRFSITVLTKDGTSRVTDYNNADIFGPITLERRD